MSRMTTNSITGAEDIGVKAERKRVRLESDHVMDEYENPAGGWTRALGVDIEWQSGPLRTDCHRMEPNGAFVETVIYAALDRLEFFQNSKFACVFTDAAISDLKSALKNLKMRTEEREERGVEGTHEV